MIDNDNKQDEDFVIDEKYNEDIPCSLLSDALRMLDEWEKSIQNKDSKKQKELYHEIARNFTEANRYLNDNVFHKNKDYSYSLTLSHKEFLEYNKKGELLNYIEENIRNFEDKEDKNIFLVYLNKKNYNILLKASKKENKLMYEDIINKNKLFWIIDIIIDDNFDNVIFTDNTKYYE